MESFIFYPLSFLFNISAAIVSGDTSIKLLSSPINQDNEITAEEDVDTKAEEQQKQIDEKVINM